MAEDGQGSSTYTMIVKFPAHGSQKGSVWNDGVHSHVKRLEIIHTNRDVWSVRIEYIDKNGKEKWGPIHGRRRNGYSGSTKQQVIDLSCPSEFLTLIHGSLGGIRINSLTFETNNERTFGPYGDQKAKGTKFSIPLRAAKIVGFHGWSHSEFLTAIGVYVQPITKSMLEPEPEPEAQPQSQPKVNEGCFSLGQYGRKDGECWEESFRAIKRLVIYSDEEWIISIQMEYEDENGNLVLSKKHGGDGGSKSEVALENPDEHLVTIKGYYDNSVHSKSFTNMIRSLTVITNNESYGPFGVEDGTEFLFPTNERLKVVGIHGRSDLYLNAIGLHVVRSL